MEIENSMGISTKWTHELKKKFNLVIKDDGDFYMAFDDFLNYYITLGVCKLHPGYKTTTLKILFYNAGK